MPTCGETLVHLLEAYDIDLIFGIPGAHTLALYRGLPSTGIRYITPHHEQGAGQDDRQGGQSVAQHLHAAPCITQGADKFVPDGKDRIGVIERDAVGLGQVQLPPRRSKRGWPGRDAGRDS